MSSSSLVYEFLTISPSYRISLPALWHVSHLICSPGLFCRPCPTPVQQEETYYSDEPIQATHKKIEMKTSNWLLIHLSSSSPPATPSSPAQSGFSQVSALPFSSNIPVVGTYRLWNSDLLFFKHPTSDFKTHNASLPCPDQAASVYAL